MRKILILAVAFGVFFTFVGLAIAGSLNMRTHLRGSQEVPAVVTNAQGQAKFKIANDGSSIDFKVIRREHSRCDAGAHSLWCSRRERSGRRVPVWVGTDSYNQWSAFRRDVYICSGHSAS